MSRTTASVETLTVHLVEDRRSVISRWGLGNSKLGDHVYTFSRLPGRVNGTCPGATDACEAVCYAKRMYTKANGLAELFYRNTVDPNLSGLPDDAEIVRIHVSGDFDTPGYIEQWISLVCTRRGVRFFGYTRAWSVPGLQKAIRRLRDETNVQLFASVDEDNDTETVSKLVSEGWRLSWMGTDLVPGLEPHTEPFVATTPAGSLAVLCLEAEGRKDNCQECGYCFNGQRGDVVFPIH